MGARREKKSRFLRGGGGGKFGGGGALKNFHAGVGKEQSSGRRVTKGM